MELSIDQVINEKLNDIDDMHYQLENLDNDISKHGKNMDKTQDQIFKLAISNEDNLNEIEKISKLHNISYNQYYLLLNGRSQLISSKLKLENEILDLIYSNKLIDKLDIIIKNNTFFDVNLQEVSQNIYFNNNNTDILIRYDNIMENNVISGSILLSSSQNIKYYFKVRYGIDDWRYLRLYFGEEELMHFPLIEKDHYYIDQALRLCKKIPSPDIEHLRHIINIFVKDTDLSNISDRNYIKRPNKFYL